jgi:hypothetical protein
VADLNLSRLGPSTHPTPVILGRALSRTDIRFAWRSRRPGNARWVLINKTHNMHVVTSLVPSVPSVPSLAAAIKGAAKASKPAQQASGVAGDAADPAAFQAYKDGLRAAMERPSTSDPGLSSIVDDLYREHASVGSGSTAAAVREELLTGQPVAGKFHSKKAADSIIRLSKWLEKNPTALPGDRAAAENIIRDLQNALKGQ